VITLGIDPGLSGAFALYNPKPLLMGVPGSDPVPGQPMLALWDMPIVMKEVSGKPRKITDPGGLYQLVGMILDVFAPDRIVIEEVGGMPGQSGSAAFNFGYGAGLLHMAFVSRGVQFDTVRPSQWKKAVKAPSDKKLAVSRADEVFPWARDKWRQPPAKGQKADQLFPDRAEAALLAFWAAGGAA
jgi:hypothetical protein